MTRRIFRTATIAIAIAALAAPTALPRPADMPPAIAKAAAAAQHEQGLRTPDTIDAAAQQNKQDPIADIHAPLARAAHGEQANPRPDTAPQPAADSGIAWSMIGLGIAGLL